MIAFFTLLAIIYFRHPPSYPGPGAGAALTLQKLVAGAIENRASFIQVRAQRVGGYTKDCTLAMDTYLLVLIGQPTLPTGRWLRP